MTIARRGLKVKVIALKVKVVGQTNAVGPTSIKGSFFLTQRNRLYKRVVYRVNIRVL